MEPLTRCPSRSAKDFRRTDLAPIIKVSSEVNCHVNLWGAEDGEFKFLGGRTPNDKTYSGVAKEKELLCELAGLPEEPPVITCGKDGTQDIRLLEGRRNRLRLIDSPAHSAKDDDMSEKDNQKRKDALLSISRLEAYKTLKTKSEPQHAMLFSLTSTYHKGKIRTCRFSPDGRYLAVGSDYKNVVVYDLENAKNNWCPFVMTPNGKDPVSLVHQDWVRDVQWRDDSMVVASGSDDGFVQLLHFNSARKRTAKSKLMGREEDRRDRNYVMGVAFSPAEFSAKGAKKIVVGVTYHGGKIFLWEYEDDFNKATGGTFNMNTNREPTQTWDGGARGCHCAISPKLFDDGSLLLLVARIDISIVMYKLTSTGSTYDLPRVHRFQTRAWPRNVGFADYGMTLSMVLDTVKRATFSERDAERANERIPEESELSLCSMVDFDIDGYSKKEDVCQLPVQASGDRKAFEETFGVWLRRCIRIPKEVVDFQHDKDGQLPAVNTENETEMIDNKPAELNSLSWGPDGRMLALGWSNGMINFMSSERPKGGLVAASEVSRRSRHRLPLRRQGRQQEVRTSSQSLSERSDRPHILRAR